MTAASRQTTPDPGAGSRYGPTPAAPSGGAGRPTPATATSREAHRWPPSHPVDQAPAQPTTTPPQPVVDAVPAHISDPGARLPAMLTVKEAAAILRVGRNQLYQAVARGEVRAVRIGRTIRIPKTVLLDLLTTPATPPTATGAPR
jgi:excisionase family DNA binding protein